MPPTQIKTNNIADSTVTDAKIASGVSATKVADGTVSNAAFQRIAGLTSDAQSQINSKQASSSELTALSGMVTTGVVKRTGAGTFAASTVGDSDIATGVAATKLADGSVSNAAFQRISGLTSDAQAQLDSKVAGVTAGDAITVSGSSTKTVGLTPGVTDPLLPMLWNGLSWENRAVQHEKISGGLGDDHQRYVDRETAVIGRNIIRPQADVVALELRSVSSMQTSNLLEFSSWDGGILSYFDANGNLGVFQAVSFIESGVTFNGLVDGLPLSAARVWVGGSGNTAAERLISGDATLSNTGVLTLANSGVSAGTWSKITVDAKGRATVGANLASSDLPNLAASSFSCTFDGGGSGTPAAGTKCVVVTPCAGTITSATMIADVSGSAVIDVKKSTYSGFPTTTSIAASAKPTLSSAQKSQDATLTGWTTSFAAGDVLEFVLDSVTTCGRVTLSIAYNRT